MSASNLPSFKNPCAKEDESKCAMCSFKFKTSTRWKCDQCLDYYICSFCESDYADEKHFDGTHTFTKSDQ